MMDAQVAAAMAKWPDVPAVFGWLRLDGRGQWWLRGERLGHQGMAAFFQRNYARDERGRYYVQNGPQKVYVVLDAAPFIARRRQSDWLLSPGGACRCAREAFVTPEGELLLDVDGELAQVDDRDLAELVQAQWPAWDGSSDTLPSRLSLPEGALPLVVEPRSSLWRRYGIDTDPQA